jgi:hypothetical protein
MATITLQINGTTVGDMTVERIVPQESSDRLMGFLAANYGLDSEGKPRAPQQIVAAYWEAIVKGTEANILNYERSRDAKAASDAVTECPL